MRKGFLVSPLWLASMDWPSNQHADDDQKTGTGLGDLNMADLTGKWRLVRRENPRTELWSRDRQFAWSDHSCDYVVKKTASISHMHLFLTISVSNSTHRSHYRRNYKQAWGKIDKMKPTSYIDKNWQNVCNSPMKACINSRWIFVYFMIIF